MYCSYRVMGDIIHAWEYFIQSLFLSIKVIGLVLKHKINYVRYNYVWLKLYHFL